MKIVIAGGSGAIGTALTQFFLQRAHEVIILSRKQTTIPAGAKLVLWDGEHAGEWTQTCADTDVVINLCGKSVNCRYTEENKLMILQSRLRSTRAIGKWIQSLKRPPQLWLNAASATIYADTLEGPQDEYTGVKGSDFSMDVCRDWEAEAEKINTPQTRKIYMRTSIVLDADKGALPLYRRLALCGFGGAMGSGEQMMSWIHIEDVCRAMYFLIEHKNIHGPVNITSPYPITNAEFMTALRKQLQMPVGINNPTWILRIGTTVLGTELELIMKSRWVFPQILLENGFHFQYPEVEKALDNLIGKPCMLRRTAKTERRHVARLS